MKESFFLPILAVLLIIFTGCQKDEEPLSGSAISDLELAIPSGHYGFENPSQPGQVSAGSIDIYYKRTDYPGQTVLNLDCNTLVPDLLCAAYLLIQEASWKKSGSKFSADYIMETGTSGTVQLTPEFTGSILKKVKVKITYTGGGNLETTVIPD